MHGCPITTFLLDYNRSNSEEALLIGKTFEKKIYFSIGSLIVWRWTVLFINPEVRGSSPMHAPGLPLFQYILI